MKDVLALGCLCIPGILPAVGIAGPGPVVLFLIPIVGALIASAASLAMFVTTGSFLTWFVLTAVVANVAGAALVYRRQAMRGCRGHVSGTSVWALLIPLAAVAWPLVVLKASFLGYDAEVIWLVHATLISGGHEMMMRSLTDSYIAPSHPDYPPLIPAAVAVVYSVKGAADQHLGFIVISVLNACAVASTACALLQVVFESTVSRFRRVCGSALVFVFGGAVFGVAGFFAVSGFADLLWGASAMAATVYGLVLPVGRRHLSIAVLFVCVAGMTKNEGFVTAVFIAFLIGVRYVQSGPRVTRLLKLCALTALPLALPAGWILAVHARGIGASFFSTSSPESIGLRSSVALSGMWSYFHFVPLAGAVAVLGTLFLRRARRQLGLGTPYAMWAVAAWGFAATFMTYVFGDIEIRAWIGSSVDRTTMFVNILLLADMTIWGLTAVISPPAALTARAFQRPKRLALTSGHP